VSQAGSSGSVAPPGPELRGHASHDRMPTAAARNLPCRRTAEQSCPHLQASWAVVARQACVSAPHGATGWTRVAWRGLSRCKRARRFDRGDVTLHLLLPPHLQEEALFPWQRAINWISVSLCGQRPLQHDRTRLSWCKRLCFIRFTLFLFFYFELYTFEK